jgi:integrase
MGTRKKEQKIMKGVSCRTIGGEVYWYAHVNWRKTYMGKGDDGRKSATAAKAKELAAKHESRELRGGLEIKRSKFMAFRDLHKWYFALPEIQQQKCLRNNIEHLGHLVKFFGNRPLNQFEMDEQSRYRAFRKREGAADGTIKLEISLLSAMFNEALENKLIPITVKPGKFDRSGDSIPRRPVTDQEYQALLDKANEDFKDVLMCAYESGMRSSEIIGLKRSQVHLDLQHISGAKLDFISLGIFDTKNKTERVIPVSDELKPVLERRIKDKAADDFVFTNRTGRPYFHQKAIGELMRFACKMAKVSYGDKTINKSGDREGIVFHSLRHTRITKWVEAGFSDEIIRRASGHRSLNAYRAYVNIKDALPIMNLVRVSEKTGNFGEKQTPAIPGKVVNLRNA